MLNFLNACLENLLINYSKTDLFHLLIVIKIMTRSNIEQQLLSYKRSLELITSERVQNDIKERMQVLCNSIGTNLKSFLQDFNEKHHAFCGGQFEFRVTRRSKPDLKIPQRDLLQMKGDQCKFLWKLMHCLQKIAMKIF